MKKLDLGGIQPATKSARPSHPSIELADAEATVLVDQWASIQPQFRTLKNQIDTLRAQIAPHIKSAYFTKFAGVIASGSTMLCTVAGKTIKFIVKNAYGKTLVDPAALYAAIGQERADENFEMRSNLLLKLEDGPEPLREPFAQAVVKLAREMGMINAVSISQCIQPKAGFHEARTTRFTAEENIAIDALLPLTAYPQI